MKFLVHLVFVLIAGTLSLTGAQEIPSKDELLQQVPFLANIPGISEFNTSMVKAEDIEKMLREKCEKSGGPTAYDTAKSFPMHATSCFQSLVNVTQLKKEMDEARPKGDLDEVFKTYCEKVPSVKKCVRNITDSVEPCLETAERANIKIIHNITNSLLEFVCHDEGDRIAMFIAAGGVECFQSKRQDVQNCANQTVGTYIPDVKPGETASIPPLSSIPLLVLDLKRCQDIEHFRTCTVNVLEDCSDPTPANVVEALFNFVRRTTPCEDLLDKEKAAANTGIDTRSTGSSGTTNFVNILLMITSATILSLRFA